MPRRGLPEVHLAGICGYAEAGFDHVYIGQAGGVHDAFFEFYANAAPPRLREGQPGRRTAQ